MTLTTPGVVLLVFIVVALIFGAVYEYRHEKKQINKTKFTPDREGGNKEQK